MKSSSSHHFTSSEFEQLGWRAESGGVESEAVLGSLDLLCFRVAFCFFSGWFVDFILFLTDE